MENSIDITNICDIEAMLDETNIRSKSLCWQNLFEKYSYIQDGEENGLSLDDMVAIEEISEDPDEENSIDSVVEAEVEEFIEPTKNCQELAIPFESFHKLAPDQRYERLTSYFAPQLLDKLVGAFNKKIEELDRLNMPFWSFVHERIKTKESLVDNMLETSRFTFGSRNFSRSVDITRNKTCKNENGFLPSFLPYQDLDTTQVLNNRDGLPLLIHQTIQQMITKNADFSIKVNEREFNVLVKNRKKFATVQEKPIPRSLLPNKEDIITIDSSTDEDVFLPETVPKTGTADKLILKKELCDKIDTTFAGVSTSNNSKARFQRKKCLRNKPSYPIVCHPKDEKIEASTTVPNKLAVDLNVFGLSNAQSYEMMSCGSSDSESDEAYFNQNTFKDMPRKNRLKLEQNKPISDILASTSESNRNSQITNDSRTNISETLAQLRVVKFFDSSSSDDYFSNSKHRCIETKNQGNSSSLGSSARGDLKGMPRKSLKTNNQRNWLREQKILSKGNNINKHPSLIQ